MCIGISFVFTSDFTFGAFMPMMMASKGFTTADAALAITTSASAELVSRICLAVFTVFVDVRPKMMFFAAMIGMTVAKLGTFDIYYWHTNIEKRVIVNLISPQKMYYVVNDILFVHSN